MAMYTAGMKICVKENAFEIDQSTIKLAKVMELLASLRGNRERNKALYWLSRNLLLQIVFVSQVTAHQGYPNLPVLIHHL